MISDLNKMAKKFLTGLIISLALIIPAHAEDETTSPFPDVEEGTKYYDAITYLYENGIISGYEDGTFQPDREVNRVEALKILLLSAGIESEASEESIFTDVVGTEWYYKYLAESVKRNIVSGYDDGTFKPDQEVNLVETLKMIVNTNQLIATMPSSGEDFFVDAEFDVWYSGYLNFAKENGLIYGDADGYIYPDKNVTRAELSYIIYRYKNESVFSGEVGFGTATYYADMFEGLTTANGEKFDQNKLTAAHRTLPFDTILRVTNLANGETIEVRVNDRGPYAGGHILDLSKVAFQSIGYLSSGVMNIEYEIIYPSD